MEKRRAYALLWQWRASSRPLSSNHRSLLPNSRSSDSGSMFNFGRTFTPLSSFTEQQRQSFQQLHNILIDRRVLHQGTFLRSSNLPLRFYGSAPVERSASFSEINTKDITYFKSILGENNVIQDPDRLQPANSDWMHKYQGSSKLMLLPRTTEEVSHIMRYCNSRHLAIVPQGGNTGLVGGSVPVFDEVIVNVSQMNKIISFDKVSGILVCEAGCILENLEYFLDNEGFVMPLDLGAKGSCQIGGNVSTNAGGLRLVRYGSLHGNVLGLEAVSANGTVMDMLGTLRKDNTGYDLKHLFIGSEGSLGIVTKVSILTPPKLSATNLAFLACKDYLSCQLLVQQLHENSSVGLEAVSANGTVMDMLGTLRKDNTGYDLKHLFIGSEGSLGIVTKVSILTPPKLSATNLAFLACKDYLSCQKLLFKARRKLGEVLSAFEFMDSHAMDAVLNNLEGVRNPLPPAVHNFYVLIETTGSDESYDRERLETFLFGLMESGLILDGVVAQDINQVSSFWRIREGIPEALMKFGAVYKYDLSLPLEKMYDLVDEMRARLGNPVKVVGYGHLGDSNLHLNITSPQYDDDILAQIEPFVYEWTSKHRGSISAEHGIGLMKANKLYYSKSPEVVQLMVSIKRLMDPNGILNPYKVLPHCLIANN